MPQSPITVFTTVTVNALIKPKQNLSVNHSINYINYSYFIIVNTKVCKGS